MPTTRDADPIPVPRGWPLTFAARALSSSIGTADCSAASWLYVVDVRNGQRLSGTSGVRTTLSTTENSSGVTAVLTNNTIVGTGQTTDGKTFLTPIKDTETIPASKNAWREIRR